MPSNAHFPLYDQMLNGRLERVLRRYRSEGLGVRQMETRLDEEHGIKPSYRTIARWLNGESGAPDSLKREAA